MTFTLVDKKYWDESWGNLPPDKTYEVLTQYFDYINNIKKISSAIEFGGYPCNYLIHLKKKFNYKIYCIDYAINKYYLKKLFYKNNLNLNKDIKLINKDLTTNIKIKKKFDLVYSIGLVEHFHNLEYILKKHLDCLKKNGIIYFTMPNLCGLNGFIMKLFDTVTYKTHNIKSMNIEKIKKILKKNGLKINKIEYASSNGIFITNLKSRNLIARSFIKIIHIFTIIITSFFLKKSKFFSNDLICIASK